LLAFSVFNACRTRSSDASLAGAPDQLQTLILSANRAGEEATKNKENP